MEGGLAPHKILNIFQSIKWVLSRHPANPVPNGPGKAGDFGYTGRLLRARRLDIGSKTALREPKAQISPLAVVRGAVCRNNNICTKMTHNDNNIIVAVSNVFVFIGFFYFAFILQATYCNIIIIIVIAAAQNGKWSCVYFERYSVLNRTIKLYLFIRITNTIG